MEAAGPARCGRWNPTGEQLKVLVDLFNAGLRTPSSEQIQKISSHLGSLGKIESKNVFYWFQNHKARERRLDSHKKRRRRSSPVMAPLSDAGQHFPADPSDDRKEIKICEETKSQETAKETLELFPLTSTSTSSSTSLSGYYGYRTVDAGAEQYMPAAVRWKPSKRELCFLDAVIDPPLELTLGFF